ncbi:FFLEELY motif protein [Acinetobacter larvae]|uniref:DUF8198 domain-containing protein n=1 Tax=Acinetobacter larvae TaxID=1789224 RepID=A0A1B2LW60_9GAMM|nr:hypothetical protein [Acinetobacter larvae]AOA57167.1 hypothetical protein BFG52_01565 [Acinetobacter larvae]
MSKLAELDHLFAQYQQFLYHNNPQLKQRLTDAQLWLKQRIEYTHQDLFAAPNHQLMAQFFINRLYGGPDFDALAQQIKRLLKHAHKVEKVLPDQAIDTGILTIRLAVLAMQLDEQIAQQLLLDYPADSVITDAMMLQTLLKLNQEQARLEQLALLDRLGIQLDKYLRSFMIQTAFKMCKAVAYKHNFQLMYDFIGEGLAAVKAMKSTTVFINDFTAQERAIVAAVHQGHANPFARVCPSLLLEVL